MSQSDKSAYYKALKDAGVQFTKHYREYSTDELAAAYNELMKASPDSLPPLPPPPPPVPPVRVSGRAQQAPPPVRPRDPNELAGQRQNSKLEDEPLRVDDAGLIWYQEEVRKPATPRPRGRRVLTYMETGTKTETVQMGEYVESFEVAGTGIARPAEVKITLPNYQVGIYRDKRFPFKVVIYNENRGFDRVDVETYFGGADLVPKQVKRKYVENVLCYDMRTVIDYINTEFRQLRLAGKV